MIRTDRPPIRFRLGSLRRAADGPGRLVRLLVLALITAAGPATAETIHRETLSNGLRVILVENHSKPLVGVCLFVNGGSRTETPALSGLSHYYEHLIFRGGSTRQKELEYRKELQRIGEESGYTTNDYTCYNFTAPTEKLDEALWRSADAWMNLRLTAAKVAKERQVVMEEFNQGEDRPDYKVYYQIERLMFRDHPYKRDTIGLKEVLQSAPLSRFQTFYRERYVPNQMILAAVGDFEAKAMLAKIERAFGSYARGPESFEQGLTEGPQSAFRMGVETMKTPNTSIYLGFHTPPQADPDAPALTVLASLLGRGSSSRLYRALKEKENLVTAVDADFEVRKDPGMFLVGAELPPQNEARVVAAIRDELKRLAAEPVPPAELSRVKSALLNRYAFGAQTMFDRAERLCQFALMSDVSLEPIWPSLIDAVTAADLQRLAARLFAADQASYSVVRPEGSAGPSEAEIRTLVAEWSADWPKDGLARAAGATSAVRREVLPNGLTLLLKEDHNTPVVACWTLARGGLWIEPQGLAGVSHMSALLLRRGAGSMNARAISERADQLGMQLSTSGGPDYASVTWQAPSRHFREAWDLYRDVILRPTFPAAEVAKVREDLVRQIRSLGDRPFDYTNLEFQRRLFKTSPYRRSVLGDTASLLAIRTADLRRAYETMFSGANLVVAVVGDFESAALLEQARRAFAGLRPGVPVTIGGGHESPPPDRVDAFVNKDQEQVTYNTGWPGCSVRDPDYAPLKAAVAFIGDRLFFKYVYEKGVAYRSWFYMRDRIGQSWATNEMGVTPANYPMASSGVLADVTEVVRGPMTERELRSTIDKMLSRYLLNAQENSALADRLAFFEIAGMGYEYADRYPELLRQLTVADVKGAARKYLDPARYTRVAVGKETAEARP